MKTYKKNPVKTAVIVCITLIIGLVGGLQVCNLNHHDSNSSTTAIDYPDIWAEAPQNTLKDSWGAGNRECTSYAAYKIYKTHGLSVSGLWGDAKHWGDVARFHQVPVDQTPAMGSVMWLPDVGTVGHLMWIDKVERKGIFYEIHASDYNGSKKGSYNEEVLLIDTKPKEITPYFIHFEKVGDRDIR